LSASISIKLNEAAVYKLKFNKIGYSCKLIIILELWLISYGEKLKVRSVGNNGANRFQSA
jgi:hypothetical protein